MIYGLRESYAVLIADTQSPDLGIILNRNRYEKKQQGGIISSGSSNFLFLEDYFLSTMFHPSMIPSQKKSCRRVVSPFFWAILRAE